MSEQIGPRADSGGASGFSRRAVFLSALRYSFPVLLGYLTIGIAFGLMLSGMGYPWWLALAMSLWMYAGAGQFAAAGLFAAGTTIWQACLIQLVLNARHIAYGLSMLNRFSDQGPYKFYQIFSLTDETFALLSSLPENLPSDRGERRLFVFLIAILDQSYWVVGSVAGALIGTMIPFDMKGIGFALTALFVVLLIEQIQRVRKPGIFLVSGIAALLGVFLLPSGISLLAAMTLALALSSAVVRLEAHEPRQ